MKGDFVTLLVWLAYSASATLIGYLVWRQTRKTGQRPASSSPPTQKPLHTIKAKNGLQSDILREGTGPGAKNKDTLTVHYTAWTQDGKQVDSSRERGYPLVFKLGAGKVIDGWEQALRGAKEGEKRKITVPPALCYGKKGTSRVPPDTTVIFEVELVKIEAA